MSWRFLNYARACCLVLVCSPLAGADLRLPALISDNMVLQRGMPVPIWGLAQPGEKVTVAIARRAAAAEADREGRWQVRLPAMEPQNQPLELVVTGSSSAAIRVKNVLVGEVWLCSGPSNIFWPVKRCDHAQAEIASATCPRIRFFTVARKTADQPQTDCGGNWAECSPATVGNQSAVGYFFARQLNQELKMPVGLLQSFWGGSRIEAWTSIEALQAQPGLMPVLDYWAQRRARPAEGPTQRENPETSAHRPACLFNGMIAPLVPYGIRGAITYQGLGNLFWAEHSQLLLETMIADWRKRWGEGDFPFGLAQPRPTRVRAGHNRGPTRTRSSANRRSWCARKCPTRGWR